MNFIVFLFSTGVVVNAGIWTNLSVYPGNDVSKYDQTLLDSRVEDFFWSVDDTVNIETLMKVEKNGKKEEKQTINPPDYKIKTKLTVSVAKSTPGTTLSRRTGRTSLKPTLLKEKPNSFRNITQKDGIPSDVYLVKTVIKSNITVLHNDIQNFKLDMEQKLADVFRMAEKKSDERLKRFRRQQPNTVQIQNIRSNLPKPELELLYSVSDGSSLIPALEIVNRLNQIDEEEMASILGFPLVNKAEAYTAKAVQHRQTSAYLTGGTETTSIIMGITIASTVLIILGLLFVLYNLKHRQISSTPTKKLLLMSEDEDPNKIISQKYFEEQLSGASAGNQMKESIRNKELEHKRSETISIIINEDDFEKEEKLSNESDISNENRKIKNKDIPEKLSSTHNKRLLRNRISPENTSKSDVKVKKSGKTLSTSLAIRDSHSAFPMGIPENYGWYGPLSDLMEEDLNNDTLDSTSRDSTSSEQSVLKSETKEVDTEKTKDRERRSTSAKSEIVREKSGSQRILAPGHMGGVASSSSLRPASAVEAKLSNVKMRHRQFEGLISGRKHVHRGRLLQGGSSDSSSSDNETQLDRKPSHPATCWTDKNSSPEIIEAIKEELHKYHRPISPNLAAISVVSDHDLLHMDVVACDKKHAKKERP